MLERRPTYNRGMRAGGGRGARQDRTEQPKQREGFVSLTEKIACRYPCKNPDGSQTTRLRDILNKVTPKPQQTFSIDPLRCLKLIEENDVVLVSSKTGSGKSTIIPTAITIKYPEATMVVTEPRRVTAVNLACCVAEKFGTEVGDRVGFSVRGEHVGIIGETKVMYVSAYSLLLYLVGCSPDAIPLDYVIIDEAHEACGGEQVISLLLREAMKYKKVNPKFKLVYCTATLEDDSLKKYFTDAGLSVGEYSEGDELCEICDMDGNDVCSLIGVPYEGVTVKSEEVMPEIKNLLMMRICLTLERLASLMDTDKHSILVFLPGRRQMDDLFMWIRQTFPDKFFPVLWSREIELKEVEDAINKKVEGRNKVYLCTDIAEVGITVSDAVIAIDSCLNKRKECNYRTISGVAFPPLKLMWESHANAKQRRGRVGRVQEGIYMSMLSKEDKEMVLSRSSGRAWSSEDLLSLIIHCLFISPSLLTVLNSCIAPPPEILIRECVRRLEVEGYVTQHASGGFSLQKPKKGVYGSFIKEWSILLEKLGVPSSKSGDEDILQLYPTFKGFITGHTPLSFTVNNFVFYGSLFGAFKTAAYLAATCGGMFPYYFQSSDLSLIQNYRTLMVHKFQNQSQTLLRAQDAFNDSLVCASAALQFQKKMEQETPSEELELWCTKEYISKNRCMEVLGTFEQMVGLFEFIFPVSFSMTKAELTRDARLLHIITVASGTTEACEVKYSTHESRKERYNADGYCIDYRCSQNINIPTCCPWQKGNACIPFTLLPGENAYLGSMATEVTRPQFFLSLLVFSPLIEYISVSGSQPMSMCKVTRYSATKYFHVSEPCMKKILHLRATLSKRIQFLREQISAGVTEGLLEGLKNFTTDVENSDGDVSNYQPSELLENMFFSQDLQSQIYAATAPYKELLCEHEWQISKLEFKYAHRH